MINMVQLRHLTVFALVSLFATTANGESLFFDSFESADMSATNADGFNWGQNNRTSVVTAERVVYSNGERDVAKPSGRDWDPKHGDHSLRFRYAAGKNWAEQRFNLGNAYRDLWLQYWVKVPINYYHGQASPNNHKFFAIWMDGYTDKGEGATVKWEFWGNSTGGSELAVTYDEGNSGSKSGHQQHRDFISTQDQGKWMEITIHVRASSSPSANDGVIELWRRWENEDPGSETLFHRISDAVLPIPNVGPSGWNAGYFMGWANAPYANDTEWLIDHITISKNSLLGSDGLASLSNPPAPPVLSLKN